MKIKNKFICVFCENELNYNKSNIGFERYYYYNQCDKIDYEEYTYSLQVTNNEIYVYFIHVIDINKKQYYICINKEENYIGVNFKLSWWHKYDFKVNNFINITSINSVNRIINQVNNLKFFV